MKTEQLERANAIKRRLKELDTMKSWIKKPNEIYILASGRSLSDSIPVSNEMREGENHSIKITPVCRWVLFFHIFPNPAN